MTPVDVAVSITVGTHRRTVPIVSLAAAFRLPSTSVREALVALVFGPPGTGDNAPMNAEAAPSWSGCAGDTLLPSERSNAASSSPFSTTHSSASSSTSVGHSEATPSDPSLRSDTTSTLAARARARDIAIILGAVHDVGWIERIVRMHAADVVDHALARTLAVPAHRVRTNYVAVFTAIVRYVAAQRTAMTVAEPPHREIGRSGS